VIVLLALIVAVLIYKLKAQSYKKTQVIQPEDTGTVLEQFHDESPGTSADNSTMVKTVNDEPLGTPAGSTERIILGARLAENKEY
jgi:hypothetical protein